MPELVQYITLQLRKSGRSIYLLMLLFSIALQAEQQPLVFFTEHSPPGEYLDEQGRVAGATVSLITQLMTELNDRGKFHLQPWARAQKEAAVTSHSVLFETVRNKAREDVYQWVGPLKIYQVNLYKKSGRPLPADPSQIGSCALRGSSFADVLHSMGFIEGKNLILPPQSEDCIQLIRLNRADLIVLSDAAFFPATQLDDLTLEVWRSLGRMELYMAFAKDVSATRVAKWQQALEQSYLNGNMRRLYQGVYHPDMLERLEDWALAKSSEKAQIPQQNPTSAAQHSNDSQIK